MSWTFLLSINKYVHPIRICTVESGIFQYSNTARTLHLVQFIRHSHTARDICSAFNQRLSTDTLFTANRLLNSPLSITLHQRTHLLSEIGRCASFEQQWIRLLHSIEVHTELTHTTSQRFQLFLCPERRIHCLCLTRWYDRRWNRLWQWSDGSGCGRLSCREVRRRHCGSGGRSVRGRWM